jgi:hypothetical protein
VLTHGGTTIDELAIAARAATTVEDRTALEQRLQAAAVRAGEGLGEMHKRYERGTLAPTAKESMIMQARTKLLESSVRQALGNNFTAVSAQFDVVVAGFRGAEVDATYTHGHAESANLGFDKYDANAKAYQNLHASNVADFAKNKEAEAYGAGEQDVGQFLESLDHVSLDGAQRTQLRARFLDAYRTKRYGSAASTNLAAGIEFFEFQSRLDRLSRGDKSVLPMLLARGVSAAGPTKP